MLYNRQLFFQIMLAKCLGFSCLTSAILSRSDVTIETDYSMEDVGQLKTRVEAFVEILKQSSDRNAMK